MTIAVFLATLGASLRITRLFNEDTIAQPWRDWLARHAGPHRRGNGIALWLVQLFECPWCLGMWVSAALTVPAVASDGADWYMVPALVLTISYLIGVAATVLATIEGIN